MLLEVKKFTLSTMFLAFFAVSFASASGDILGTKLTPLGANPNPSSNGDIPAWTGGLITPPEGYVRGEPHIDPYSAEQPILKISAENVDEYRNRLTNTQLSLISKYSTLKFSTLLISDII